VTSKHIYFVAGEASADNHGAALMRSLREQDPRIQFFGRGGPQMRAVADGQFNDWIAHAAVVGLWDVLRSYGYFRKKFQETLDEIDRTNPSAVVLIDYPGFNLRLARALRRRKFSRKIIYYISPQVWAWNRGRIVHMARWIDLMLCIFPFEADLFNQAGLRTRFVGHPMIDRLAARKITARRDPDLIGLFPGSRKREIRKIFPVLVKVMERLHALRPGLRFEVGAVSPEIASTIKTMLGENRYSDLEIQINTGDSAGLMQRAQVGVVASGSATLEAAYFRLPFVLIYKLAWLSYIAARIVVRVDYIGMPNLLAGKEVVPEFIQHQASPDKIARTLLSFIDTEAKRKEMICEFDQVMQQLGDGGGSELAANEIMSELNAASPASAI
jgi:lipid-A-disaccharide synthase